MSPEYKLHFNRNHKYDKCVTATSMYTLNDSSVTIIPNTKMNLKDVNMRKEGMKSREKEWKVSKNFNEKATDTPLPKKLSSNEILLHSDFPFDIRRSFLSLKPLDLMILIGYSFSTDCDHREHESNLLIAKDIFQFVLNENNLKPEECLFIDDTTENTETASQLGINVWNNNPKMEDVIDLFTIKKDLF